MMHYILRLFMPAVVAVAFATTAHGQAVTAARAPGSIAVRANGKETIFSTTDLAKLTRRHVRMAGESADDSSTVSGMDMWDVLQLAHIPSTEASGRQRVVMYIRLAGADGQNAVLSLVEVDPSFSNRTVVIADKRNGKL
ncbi:MAG: hypothetical protein ABJB66_05755 [Gemmatimonadaceae bacterium]